MLNLSRRWHEPNGLPIWVYLEALVQVLAVGGAGPTYKPEEFAPLLGALVQSDVQSIFSGFQLEDLGELADIDARAFELSDDEAAEFANKVHQIKLSGSDSRSESGPGELHVAISRRFQSRRITDNTAAQKAREEATREENKKAELVRQIGMAALTKERLPHVKYAHQLRLWVPFGIFAAVLCTGLYWSWVNTNKDGLWGFGLILLADVAFPILRTFLFPRSESSFLQEAHQEAEIAWKEQSQSVSN